MHMIDALALQIIIRVRYKLIMEEYKVDRYIGGEFGRKSLFPQKNVQQEDVHIRYTMSGRTAMHLIMQDILAQRKIHSILLPSYCSRSMIEPIVSCGITVKFYKVFLSDNGISFDYPYDNSCEGILLMDYFGYCSDEITQIANIERQNGKCVIIDKTQSFLCNRNYEEIADYTLVSFRKWFPVNAAQAYAHEGFVIPKLTKINEEYEILRSQVFRIKYLDGHCKGLIERCDELLRNDYKWYGCSDVELAYFGSVNFQSIVNVRRDNAKYLTKKIIDLEIPQISLIYNNVNENDCPLYVPVIVTSSLGRNHLNTALLKKKIECYIHWQLSPYHDQSYGNDTLYTSELSLFCDQRYTTEDMDFIVTSIMESK